MGTLIILDEDDIPIVFEFLGSATRAASASHTIPFSFGADVAGRKHLLAVHFAANVTLSATIGGVSTTPFVDGNVETIVSLSMRGAENVTGTSGDVVLNFSGSTGVIVGLWRMLDAQSLTPIATALDQFPFTSTTPQGVAIDGLEGGAIWSATTTTTGDLPTFDTGISTTDYSGSQWLGGHEILTADELGRSIQIAQTGGGTWAGVLGAVSFR